MQQREDDAATTAAVGGMSTVADSYTRLLSVFMQHHKLRDLHMPAQQLDAYLVSYFDHIYLEGTDAGTGEKLLI